MASGLADYLGLDPVLVRLGFILLALLGGTGIVVYLVAWLLVPESGSPPNARPSSTRTVGVVFLAVVLAASLGGLNLRGPSLLWAVALIGLGVLLFQQNARDTEPETLEHADAPQVPDYEPRARPAPGAVPPPSPPPPAGGAFADEHGWTPPPPPPPAPRAARQRPILLRLTLGPAFLALGVLGFIDLAATGLEPAASDYLALALAVVGVGLLVGTWFGRSRALIAVGLLLVPTVLTVSFFEDVMPPDAVWNARVGGLNITPTEVGELEPRYDLAAGELTLDLAGLSDEPDAVATIGSRIGFGAIEVLVPADAQVELDARAGAGEIDVLDDQRAVEGGIGLQRERVLEGSGPTLRLDLEVGLGEIVIRRVGESAALPSSRTPIPFSQR